MVRFKTLLVLQAALLACGCGAIERAQEAPPATPPGLQPASESIGVATMSADGVITLQLRAEGPNGEIGDALFTYAPDNSNYQSVIAHLGGIRPGETKPVPPWPN